MSIFFFSLTEKGVSPYPFAGKRPNPHSLYLPLTGHTPPYPPIYPTMPLTLVFGERFHDRNWRGKKSRELITKIIVFKYRKPKTNNQIVTHKEKSERKLITTIIVPKCRRPKTKDQILFSCFEMIIPTSSQMQQTKDQRPDPIQLLWNEHTNFLSNAADQRPRTRLYSVTLKGTNQLPLQCSRPKTKDQIIFSCFVMNKLTSSRMPQAKVQGPDPIQLLWNEQTDFLSNAADQIPRTRSYSVDYKWTNQLPLKCSKPKTKDQIVFSCFEINIPTSSQMQQTKDQGPDPIQLLWNEQTNFLSNASDQRSRTRLYSVA
jgi:hypothetical protein